MFKVGDKVVVSKETDFHRQHLFSGGVFTVVASPSIGGIKLDRCDVNGPGCDCQKRVEFDADYFVRYVEITSEEARNAKPLPSVDAVASYFLGGTCGKD